MVTQCADGEPLEDHCCGISLLLAGVTCTAVLLTDDDAVC